MNKSFAHRYTEEKVCVVCAHLTQLINHLQDQGHILLSHAESLEQSQKTQMDFKAHFHLAWPIFL